MKIQIGNNGMASEVIIKNDDGSTYESFAFNNTTERKIFLKGLAAGKRIILNTIQNLPMEKSFPKD